MVLLNSLVSFAIVIVFFIYVQPWQEYAAHYQYGELAFLTLPFFLIASFLSLVALIDWVKKIKNREYKSKLGYFSIAPSIPMFLIWVLIGIYL